MARTAATNRFSVRNMPYSIIHTKTNGDEFTTTNTFNPNGQSWSLFWWARTDILSATQILCSQPDGVEVGSRTWLSYNSSNSLLQTSLGGSSRSFSGKILDTRWHHYGLVHDDTANTFTFYVDGVADATVLTSFTPVANTAVIRFGLGNTGTVPFDGNMTNVLRFSDVVTADEALDIYRKNYYDRTNLTLEYLMTDGTGSSITDTSGTGDNGIIVDLTWGTDTPFTQRFVPRNMPYSLYFDGTNDWVDFGNNYDKTGAAAFSLSGWVKIDAYVGTIDVMIAKYAPTLGFRFSVANTGVLDWILAGSDYMQVKSSGTTMRLDTWYHVALTYSGSGLASGVKFYINGVLQGNAVARDSFAGSASTSSALRIGADANNLSDFNGWLTHWRVHSAELTQTEVQDLYYKNYVTSAQGEWLMTEGSGSSLADSVGSATGTLAGNTAWKTDAPSKVRTTNSAFRIPIVLRDYGLTSFWDMRTGYTGQNSGAIQDMIGNAHANYLGGSALSSVYTNGEYTVDLNKVNTDYFKTNTLVAPSSSTKFSALVWFDFNAIGSTEALLAAWDPSTNKRRFIMRKGTDETLQIAISADGVGTSIWTEDTASADTINTMYCFIVTFDASGGAAAPILYSAGASVNSSPLSGNPTEPTIYAADEPFTFGTRYNNTPTTVSFHDGKLGICAIANGTTWTPTQVSELYNLTKALGGY